MEAIGSTTWVVMNARLPGQAHGEPGRLPRAPRRADSDGVLVLNTAAIEARLTLTVFPAGGPTAGPYERVVPGSAATFLEFADLMEASLFTGAFCAVVEVDRPVVVEHVSSRGADDGHVRAWSHLGYAAIG